ncbi:MAG: MFS transporter [Rickettsiaceae bacterium]|nr:MFS transporter [Rickettsiaceae bacterium]
MGKLSDAFDRITILLILSVSILAICLLLPLIASSNPSLIYIIIFFLGGLCFTTYPLSIAHVCDYLENTNVINVTGVLLFSYGVGAVMGPPIAAIFIHSFSTVALFYYMASVSLLLCLLIMYYKNSESTNTDQQVKFMILPRIYAIASKIYPKRSNKPKLESEDKTNS